MAVIVSADPIRADAPVRQFSRAGVAVVWAAAAVPMGLLAWVVAPTVAGAGASPRRFAVTLIVALTAGLVWQFVLVMLVVGREQHSLRWAALRRALWLEPPTGAGGRRGGRLWLWVIPCIAGDAALSLVPAGWLAGPANRNLGTFLGSAAGHQAFHGAWGLYAVVLVMVVFNTVLGEELLFRGLLLPRMRGVFGRADWIANAVLFGLYHLHEPWIIPDAVVSGMLFAYPSRRFRSAWMGIAIHSTESLFFAVLLLTIVLS
jgi:CAAX protease family protein